MTSAHSGGPNEPNDLDLSSFTDDATLVARLRASYARVPATDAAQIARCSTAVLAEAMHAPTRRFGGALRPRWWWGATAAAVLVVSVMRPWRPEVAVQRAGSAFAGAAPATGPVGTTAESGDAIRFDLTLPSSAQEVALVGDFNGWDEHATPMIRRSPDGAWTARVPLPPGRHVYAFVIDGRTWLVDPLAPQVPDEGYGPANAVVVDGPQ
ncbi:isoamylase early set domain-containing protein [Gemmatimonas sp.]|uniref:isoamylase early set domain-containing protein n=1 Tax=Gemmatimonas sp. TaxID=1962908 RepID=UPI00286D071B|nr:isoamylase early set domain-containing protein [Gemmatimonas sp.]